MFILLSQLNVIIDNTPREDIDLSRNVVAIAPGGLRINYLIRVINRGAKTGNSCHVYGIDVVTDHAELVCFSIFMLNLMVIVRHAGFPDQSPVNYIRVSKIAVNLVGSIVNRLRTCLHRVVPCLIFAASSVSWAYT